jgi:hypothetical protein
MNWTWWVRIKWKVMTWLYKDYFVWSFTIVSTMQTQASELCGIHVETPADCFYESHISSSMCSVSGYANSCQLSTKCRN